MKQPVVSLFVLATLCFPALASEESANREEWQSLKDQVLQKDTKSFGKLNEGLKSSALGLTVCSAIHYALGDEDRAKSYFDSASTISAKTKAVSLKAIVNYFDASAAHWEKRVGSGIDSDAQIAKEVARCDQFRR